MDAPVNIVVYFVIHACLAGAEDARFADIRSRGVVTFVPDYFYRTLQRQVERVLGEGDKRQEYNEWEKFCVQILLLKFRFCVWNWEWNSERKNENHD